MPAFLPSLPPSPAPTIQVSTLQSSTLQSSTLQSSPLAQVTPVSQLTDVKPTDWAFPALQSLVERYDCISGYSDQTFRGNRAVTRLEFAAGLNTCLEQILNGQIGEINGVKVADLETIQRLQTEFAAELATLKGRVDRLDALVGSVEKQQFSTTTKLTGQVIFAVNAGGFGGDRILAPRGATVTQEQPNATSLYRVSFDLNTSFTGKDLLKLRLLSASPGIRDNAAGYLEPNLGSVLDFAIPGRQDVSLTRAYYTFSPHRDISVTLGSQMVAQDFINKNRYANASFRDFSTLALVNNFILLPRPGGAGAAIAWQPSQAFTLRGVYIASSGAASLPENQQFFGGGRPQDIRLFPASGGGAKGGLFGDPYMGVVELEYAPTKAVRLRLQTSGGKLLGSRYQVFGANLEVALSRKVGLFGRYGLGHYPDTILGDIRPQYWSAGIAFQDLLTPNDLAGLGVAQPFSLSQVGNATQTNFEAFYNFPISRNIRLTPILQVITHPANQDSNGTIVTGTLRTVFSF